MREYLNKFKKFRKDPKKRSISLLIIYGIFFIFVFIYVRGYNPVNSNIVSTSKSSISNYEYSIDFNINNEVISFDGIYLDSQNKLNIDSKYMINNNIISYNNINISYDFIINKLNYNSINKFIDSYEYESKTEYKDTNIKYEYIINNVDIALYLNEENRYEGNTNITIYKKDYINEVVIDLSSYYNSNYVINIKYNNINNISNITTNEKID